MLTCDSGSNGLVPYADLRKRVKLDRLARDLTERGWKPASSRERAALATALGDYEMAAAEGADSIDILALEFLENGREAKERWPAVIRALAGMPEREAVQAVFRGVRRLREHPRGLITFDVLLAMRQTLHTRARLVSDSDLSELASYSAESLGDIDCSIIRHLAKLEFRRRGNLSFGSDEPISETTLRLMRVMESRGYSREARSAALSLGLIGDLSAVPVLLKCLPEIGVEAVVALEVLDDVRAVGPLIDFIEHPRHGASVGASALRHFLRDRARELEDIDLERLCSRSDVIVEVALQGPDCDWDEVPSKDEYRIDDLKNMARIELERRRVSP
jgi:hypothetical protein